jgi:epoxide hydrolase 4
VKALLATAIGVLAAAAGVFGRSDTPAISHEYADVNGVRLHYARAGRGPLMIFLHGFPEFWYEWTHQIAEFSRDHTVVAPDMRGYNLSAKPAAVADYAMPKLVEDVRALAAALLPSTGGDRFTLVAHDWGGVVAWVFAAQHPQMLDRLVIVNAPHPNIFSRLLADDPKQQQASQYMLMFRGPNAEQTLSANGYAMLTTMVLGAGLKDGTVTEADRKMYIEAWSQPGALTGGLNYYRAAGVGPPSTTDTPARADRAPSPAPAGDPPPDPPSLAQMPTLLIRVPTLVVWGEKDTALLPGNLQGLDRVVPALTIKRIPEGTHWVVRENAPEVNRAIRAFITEH